MPANNLRVSQRMALRDAAKCSRVGPASLAEEGYAFAHIPAGVTREQYESIRSHLYAQYTLWASTWVTPVLENLEGM
jgi:hypothetical protein